MLRLTIVFAACFSFSAICQGANDSADSEKMSDSGTKFFEWVDQVGLSNTFHYESEEAVAGNHSFTIYAGNLENVIGANDANSLYRDLFLKFVTFSSEKPTNTMLKVQLRDGGYCDAAIIEKSIRLSEGEISMDVETIRGPIGILCSLDFDRIREYEQATDKAIKDIASKTLDNKSFKKNIKLTTDQIENYMENKFSVPGVKFITSEKTENWISLVVKNIRNEVIDNEKYWERLQLFIFVSREANFDQVRLVLDGKYAAGLRAPSSLGYTDMEPKYVTNLSEYGNKLIQELVGL